MANANHFDPMDQPVGPELVNEVETDASMFMPDTNGDPIGSEDREARDPVHLPDFYYKKYALDAQQQPIAQQSRVQGIMEVFHQKKNTPYQHFSKDEEVRQKEEQYYQDQVDTVCAGLLPLLECDPQSTGINFLQLTTRTWAEFASIAYEYKEETNGANPNEALPDWLIEREDKMFDLGRKARLLTDALLAVDQEFGNLKNVSIQRDRVEVQVKDRQQRLAEYNFKKQADTSGRTRRQLNEETVAHMQSIVDDA